MTSFDKENWERLDKALEAYIPTPDPLTPGSNLTPERPSITITVPTSQEIHCACGKDLEPKQKNCAQCRLTKQQRRSPVVAVSLTEGARWYSVADSMLWEWLDKAHAIWLADGSVWDQINGFRKDPPRDWETVRAQFGIG